MAKKSQKDLEEILQRCTDIENFVKLKRDGSVEPVFRASSSKRAGDYQYAVADLFSRTKDNEEAAIHYNEARREHLKRAANQRQADAETYVTLVLICDGMQKCGEHSFSDGRNVLQEKKEYFEKAIDKYEQKLSSLTEGRKLHRYVINMRMMRLYEIMGQQDEAKAAKKKARECMPLNYAA